MSEARGTTVSSVLVVVPAHDEERLLGRCLAAVRASAEELRRTHPDVVTRTVVVLDACTDGSAAVAAEHGVDTVTVQEACVGAARAHGVRRARELDATAPAHQWLACTDADSVVPVDWLTVQVDAAGSGADLVLGAARPDPVDLDPELLRAWRLAQGRADAHGRAVHGANLGVRTSAYLDAGGFPSLAEHEDVTLVRALAARGAVAVPGVAVLTSARLEGRAPGGFAGFLRDLLPRGEAAASALLASGAAVSARGGLPPSPG